jgi:DeoR family suf operon transcriptional repressor
MATTLHAALENVPSTRRRILEHIKKRGEARAEEIAGHLAISVQGTRQHLTALERDGLVAHREHRDGLGRPKYIYALTSAGDALFPRNYGELANELLEYVNDEDPGLVERIFDRRAQRRLSNAIQRISGMDFPRKVEEIASILDEDGYLADFEVRDDGSFLIREHNCAVLTVAMRYSHACGSELDFLQAALPEAEVTRVAHRLAGGHICAYVVRPLKTATSPGD